MNEATQAEAPAVAIIDEALAKKLWPEGDALGQRIQFATDNAPRAKREGSDNMGIGARRQRKHQAGRPDRSRSASCRPPGALFLRKHRAALFTFPLRAGIKARLTSLSVALRFRTRGRGHDGVVRRTVQEVDPTLPILSLKTFRQHVDSNLQLWTVRAGATLFSVFGGLALLLAIVGVYGVKAYSVARRTREIGIRMALGAGPNTVQWMIMREGSFMLAAGWSSVCCWRLLSARSSPACSIRSARSIPVAFSWRHCFWARQPPRHVVPGAARHADHADGGVAHGIVPGDGSIGPTESRGAPEFRLAYRAEGQAQTVGDRCDDHADPCHLEAGSPPGSNGDDGFQGAHREVSDQADDE